MTSLLPRSIRARLWTAIALLSLAVVSVSLMTWIGLQRVDQRMEALHQQSLSRVAQAIDLSKRSSDLATSAPYLLNQRSNFLIDQEGRKLISVLETVRQEWPARENTSSDHDTDPNQLSIAPITIQMESGIKDLVGASKRLDVIQSDVRRVIAVLGDLREQIVNAIEDPNVDNDQRLLWWTLQSMNADALNAAYANNLIGVGEEQRQYQRQKRQLLSEDLNLQQQMLADQLQSLVRGDTGIFELRRLELSINLEAQNALFRIRRDANLVNELAVEYARQAENFLSQQRLDSSSTIQFIKITLAAVSLVSLILAMSAALFVSKYVARSIGQVSDAMVRLAQGDRTSVLPRKLNNDDEIGDLFRSFRNFRANALRLDRSHKQLNQRNALFEKVFANIAYGIAITDPTGKVTASNPAMARILLQDTETSLGNSLVDWFMDSKFRSSATESNLNIDLRGQIELIADDGQILELRASRLPDDGRVWLLADVTESHNMSARLAQIDRIETLGKVAGDTAHDFANILSTIRTHAHLLKGEANEVRSNNVSAIENAVEYGSSLTERLLAFARKQNLAPEKVELNNLVEGMADLIEIGLKDGVSLKVNKSDKPLHVLADPGQLESTLLNLVLNANNAIEGKGLIEVSLGSDPLGEASIIVRDDGFGMSNEVKTRSIEPFFSTRTADGGTGLGLSIVYGFIKQSGGNLEIESEVGKGTQVTVTLPMAQPTSAGKITGPTKAALVVDDDGKVRKIVAKILKDLDYEATLCSNPKDAFKNLDQNEYELVVSDFDLGSDVNGYQILQKAAQKIPSAQRMLISGKSSLDKVDVGTNILVQKPITPEKLKTALKRICATTDS